MIQTRLIGGENRKTERQGYRIMNVVGLRLPFPEIYLSLSLQPDHRFDA